MRRRAPAVLVAALTAVALGACSHPPTAAVVGKGAPGWSARSVTGSPVSLSDERGRWVVLNFFATWCGPCQRETPQLRTFAAQHRGAGDAAVVGVLYHDSSGAARAFVAHNGVTWPIVVDTGGAIAARYPVFGLPISYVIDPRGVVRARVLGGVTAVGLDRVLAGSG